MNDDLVTRADDLDERATNGVDVVGSLVAGFRQQRRWIWWLAVSLAVEAVIIIVLLFGGLALKANVDRTARAVAASVQNRESLLAACRVGEAADATRAALHRFVFDVANGNPDLATRRQFEALVAATFEPRHCERISR